MGVVCCGRRVFFGIFVCTLFLYFEFVYRGFLGFIVVRGRFSIGRVYV